MTPPTRAGHCPACGATLPPDAPEGLCPRCLLQSGLANPSPVLSPGGTTPHPGPFVAPAPADLAPHFPQLEILELVGQGGMGAVYKARQTKLDRLVALKILPPEWGKDPAFAERFTREARALARLNHPHIVAVHDFGETGGLFYLLMEFVDGGNLRQRLQAGPLPPEQALAVIPQLCDALEYAHEEGIVHRDVKPENILLDRRGRAKIADFGLAKLLGKPRAEFTLTASHQVMGTLDYMAPEQRHRPLEIDHRADIYSLGVVFYEMLTGELPLGRFAPPSRRTGVDARIDEVLFRALETDPDLRYQSAGALKTDLQSGAETASAVPSHAELISRPVIRPPEEVRKRVGGPATGLLVTGVIQLAIQAAWVLTAGVNVCRDLIIYVDWSPHLTNGGWISVALLAWGFLGLVTAAVLIQAGLRMERFRSYRLALISSALAMLPVSPIFLLGLPVASWALVVLRDPEVEAAFAAEARRVAAFRKRRLTPQPTGPVRRRVRSFFRSVRSLMLYSSPQQEASPSPEVFAAEQEGRDGPAPSAPSLAVAGHDGPGVVIVAPQPSRRNGFVWIMAVVAFGIPVVLVVACMGYGGLAGRPADEQTTPAAKRTAMTTRAWMGPARGVTMATSVMRSPEPIKASTDWREGLMALDADGIRTWGLKGEQPRKVLATMKAAYQEYLELEAKHARRSFDEEGHLHVTVSPFPKELASLEDRTWAALDQTLGREQQSWARSWLSLCGLLGCRSDARGPQSLFPKAAGWSAEIWKVGTWYHWKITREGDGLNGNLTAGAGPELPLPWQRFWRGGKP